MGGFKGLCSGSNQLSYWKGDPTANVRMNCLNREDIADYFALLKKDVLTENQLLSLLSMIYYLDETGMTLDGHVPKVAGQKKVRYLARSQWSHLLFIASGQRIPPFVIFDANWLYIDWRIGKIVELLMDWAIKEHFLALL